MSHLLICILRCRDWGKDSHVYSVVNFLPRALWFTHIAFISFWPYWYTMCPLYQWAWFKLKTDLWSTTSKFSTCYTPPSAIHFLFLTHNFLLQRPHSHKTLPAHVVGLFLFIFVFSGEHKDIKNLALLNQSVPIAIIFKSCAIQTIPQV